MSITAVGRSIPGWQIGVDRVEPAARSIRLSPGRLVTFINHRHS
ncbi:hypothetical protein GB880_015350 (plasmid) [Paracoccus sp. SMMA_5_TC]|nr:hypothetical protein [Paracoccus sp. SMMA_5_TC]UXU82546.1 hypothetical protein GB880_015350 [Paracoccus sp. SMMA_5_TC]